MPYGAIRPNLVVHVEKFEIRDDWKHIAVLPSRHIFTEITALVKANLFHKIPLEHTNHSCMNSFISPS